MREIWGKGGHGKHGEGHLARAHYMGEHCANVLTTHVLYGYAWTLDLRTPSQANWRDARKMYPKLSKQGWGGVGGTASVGET